MSRPVLLSAVVAVCGLGWCGGLAARALGAEPPSAAPPPTAAAEAPPKLGDRLALPLVAAGSLAGWDQGAEPPTGWTVDGNTLIASRGASPLVSGFAIDDGEVRFEWRAPDDGGLRLYLAPVPQGTALAVTLRTGVGCGMVTRNDDLLLGGATEPLPAAEWHSARVRREGARLTIDVDGRETGHVDLPGPYNAARFALGLGAFGGGGQARGLTLEETRGGLLFNGRDLAGWWTPGNLDSWTVEDGGLVCLNSNGNYLRTEKPYGNFVLSLAYKIRPGGNSGVGIRTPRDGWPSGDGMEIQIMDERPGTPLSRHSTTGIYGNLEPLAKADRSGEWNVLVVRADGPQITAWVNGQLTQQANTARLPELRHRHPAGWIGFQDHGARIEFRDVRLRELPAGPGLAVWSGPHAEPGSAQVLARLMNPIRVATDPPLDTRSVMQYVSRPDEQTILDAEGPAALVQLTRQNRTGRIAFYFDDESEPRIECAAQDLFQHVPAISESQEPLVTYVPFKKRLRIVVREAKPGAYAADLVRFGADTPLDEYESPERAAARGLLPALSYRFQQLGWDKYRDYEPTPRATGQTKELAPGARQELLTLDGAGFVQWLRLRTGRQQLGERDDLWIEVHVDGRSEPSVALPARYLFPGFQTGTSFRNFLMTKKDGFRSFLPMPYGAGLRAALVNRGQETLRDLALEVSYVPATNTEAAPWRLVALWEPGESTRSHLARLSGQGRLVGIVAQQTDKLPPLETPRVDGEPLSGRIVPDLSLFFGVPAARPAAEPVVKKAAAEGRGRPKAAGPDERHALSGRQGELVWRFLLLDTLGFDRSLELETAGDGRLGDRVVFWYRAE